MKSELLNIGGSVYSLLNYKETFALTQQVETEALVAKLAIQCEELKQRWTHEMFGVAKDHAIRRYIQFHQAGIITLSDEVYQVWVGDALQTVQVYRNQLRAALDLLQGLISFLQINLYQYFDPAHPVSAYQLSVILPEFNALIFTVKDLLEGQLIDSTLQQVILASAAETLSRWKRTGTSSKNLQYILTIYKEIHAILVSGGSSTEQMAVMLFTQNFNSITFEEWYRAHVLPEVQVSKARTREAALQLLPVIQENAFDPSRKAIDELLRDWLSKRSPGPERTLLRKQNETITADPARLPLNLSVAQFALFTRLCFLEGCFQTTNITAILRFFTIHFETKKQPNISLKSFGRAFYTADQATAAIVRDYLQRMIGLIDKTYFPKT